MFPNLYLLLSTFSPHFPALFSHSDRGTLRISFPKLQILIPKASGCGILKKHIALALLFSFGGAAYVGIEILYRSYSHYSMFFAGGICFVLIDKMQQTLGASVPFWLRAMAGALIITVVEFFTGCIVNLWANIDVWDYSQSRFQFLGQICFHTSVLWIFLSGLVIGISNFLHTKIPFFVPEGNDVPRRKGEDNGEMQQMRQGNLRRQHVSHRRKELLRGMRGLCAAAIRLFQRIRLCWTVYEPRRRKIS